MQLLKTVPLTLAFGFILVSPANKSQAQTVISEYLKKQANDAAAGDEYGIAVAVDGDWAVIGAQSDQDISQVFDLGAAYIYYRHQAGSNQWGQFKKLSTTLSGSGNRFLGASVAISGDTVVVGAYQPDQMNAGAVYIFDRNQGGSNQWGEVTRITPADGVEGDQFGFSVDIDDDTMVVGANRADASGSVRNSGAAYVFGRDEGGPNNWGQVRKLEPAMPFENDVFGEAISIHGDTVAVGVPGDDDFGSNTGSVCLFARNEGGADQWGFIKKISQTPHFANDQFGNSVALYRDTLVGGARLADTTDVNTGAAYVFERDEGGTNQWGQVRQLSVGSLGGDQFGAGVSVFENEIAVGAPHADETVEGAGSVYLFRRDLGGSNAWGLSTVMGASDAEVGDKLGEAVSLHDGVIFGGASWNDDAGSRSGSAYVFWFPSIPPPVAIATSGTNAVISWNPPSPDFILQRSGNLDSAVWTMVPGGSVSPVTVSMHEAMGFFRLAVP